VAGVHQIKNEILDWHHCLGALNIPVPGQVHALLQALERGTTGGIQCDDFSIENRVSGDQWRKLLSERRILTGQIQSAPRQQSGDPILDHGQAANSVQLRLEYPALSRQSTGRQASQHGRQSSRNAESASTFYAGDINRCPVRLFAAASWLGQLSDYPAAAFGLRLAFVSDAASCPAAAALPDPACASDFRADILSMLAFKASMRSITLPAGAAGASTISLPSSLASISFRTASR